MYKPHGVLGGATTTTTENNNNSINASGVNDNQKRTPNLEIGGAK